MRWAVTIVFLKRNRGTPIPYLPRSNSCRYKGVGVSPLLYGACTSSSGNLGVIKYDCMYLFWLLDEQRGNPTGRTLWQYSQVLMRELEPLTVTV